jgi:predicted phage terminase large subunit-like protein
MAAHLTQSDIDRTQQGDDEDDWNDPVTSTAYKLYPHTRLLSRKFRDAAFGVSRRQIWALPPRYGKSILASQWGPAWYLEWFPHKRVILASYGHDLALHNARITRDIFRTYGSRLTTRLKADASAADQWMTEQGGGLKAAGVGGALTGFGSDLCICDDVTKDWEEAQSANQREKVWDWYRSVLRTRLHKGGSIIVLATRWHLDDLSGRLLAEDARRVQEGKPPIWDYVRLPTIADGEARGVPDMLGRADGEVLCEDLFPAIEVLEQREELGDLIFGAMHQQDPTEVEGSIIKREWLQRYDAPPEHQDFYNWAMSCDLAFKDTSTSDFVVLQVWARGPGGHYLIDQARGRWSYTDTKREIHNLWRQYPLINRVLVEDKANGPAVISDMAGEIPGMVPINPLGSKESRVHAVTPMMRTGHVWIPTNALLAAQGRQTWADDLINECCAFPNGINDDQVDALSQYLINTGGGPLAVGRSAYGWSSRFR